MKKMKKIFAVMLSLAMVLGMAMTVSAAGEKPVPANTAQVTIGGLESGASYVAYQIIEAKYNDEGFIGYEWVAATGKTGEISGTIRESDNVLIVDGLDSDFITALAADSDKLSQLTQVKGTANDETVNPNLNAGTWLVIVTPPETDTAKIYNPMVVSVYYSVGGSDDTLVGGTVTAADNWTLKTENAFAKSSGTTFDKELDDPTFDTEVKVGQDVSFTITSEIPSYNSAYYKNPTFKITDEIVNGLKYKTEPVVTVGTTTLTKDTDYTTDFDATKGKFTITFTSEYITGLAGKPATERAVTVKYTAEITADAVKKIGENKATLEYTTKPGDTTEKEDRERVFTFALNGVFGKTDENGDPLKDATFTLYEKVDADTEDATEIKWDTNTTVYGTVFGSTTTTVETEGAIQFKGLDGDKTYYLMETAAPNGYSINDTIYRIDITFDAANDVNNDGTATYKIKVTNNKGEEEKEFTVTIYGAEEPEANLGEFGNEASGEKILIPNTRLSGLPSTGGIGTTIFTIGGCAIMIIAAGLFFASRRKSAKDASK